MQYLGNSTPLMESDTHQSHQTCPFRRVREHEKLGRGTIEKGHINILYNKVYCFLQELVSV